ncbi:MAG: pyridoxal phosphate-dependent aminotransferase [Phycisphaerales bacterium]|nr:pyridoxal phosphate-dependent aminotransferase [Phycisphaerales bacterium]
MPALPIAEKVAHDIKSASWVREMFERGRRLKARLGDENVYDFSLGNPNAEPPREFFDAMRMCAAEHNPPMHRYMSNNGYEETRSAVARFVSREYRAPYDAGGVIMTAGAAAALNVALRAILNPGDEVIVFEPYFPEYRFYIEQAQGRMVVAPTDDSLQPDLEAFDRAITPRTRAIIVNSPNNPTGVVYSERTCRGLAELVARRDSDERPLYVLCDDIYRRLIYDIDWCPALAPLVRRSIVVSSYSKDLSVPGERIGYLAMAANIPQRDLLVAATAMLNRTLGFVNAPAFMQRVIARCADALCDVNFYRENRDLLCGALRDFGYELNTPGGAFYAFPRSPIDDIEFIDVLTRHNILAVPGSGFGRPGHFRLSYCVDRKTIERSLPAFDAALRECRDARVAAS